MNIEFRTAKLEDLPQIIKLLADDDLGKKRERLSEDNIHEYRDAFLEIESSPTNEIVVGVAGDKIIAVLQMTFIPNLTLRASKRAQIEGVRVSSEMRGEGLGKKLFAYAFEVAKRNGCKMAQLTTNKSRSDAMKFYEALGFRNSHEGMKIELK